LKRELINDRTAEGRERAKARGKHMGRMRNNMKTLEFYVNVSANAKGICGEAYFKRTRLLWISGVGYNQ